MLADAAPLAIDQWWALGDLVLFNARPVEVLELLADLPGIRYVRGNTDRYVVTGEQPDPHATAADAAGDVGLVERYAGMAAGSAWTASALEHAGWLDWLADLPTEQRIDLPGRGQLLGIHASYGRDDGAGIDTDIADADLAGLFAGCRADVVVGGHTHVSTDRVAGGVRFLNGGSTGMPRRAHGACWLLLDISDAGVAAQHRVVPFDVEAVAADNRRRRHPNAPFVEPVLRRAHPFAH